MMNMVIRMGRGESARCAQKQCLSHSVCVCARMWVCATCARIHTHNPSWDLMLGRVCYFHCVSHAGTALVSGCWSVVVVRTATRACIRHRAIVRDSFPGAQITSLAVHIFMQGARPMRALLWRHTHTCLGALRLAHTYTHHTNIGMRPRTAWICPFLRVDPRITRPDTLQT